MLKQQKSLKSSLVQIPKLLSMKLNFYTFNYTETLVCELIIVPSPLFSWICAGLVRVWNTQVVRYSGFVSVHSHTFPTQKQNTFYQENRFQEQPEIFLRKICTFQLVYKVNNSFKLSPGRRVVCMFRAYRRLVSVKLCWVQPAQHKLNVLRPTLIYIYV